jgi:hypothetical protein
MGFAYNLGRIVSAAAPYTVGRIAETRGFSFGLFITTGGFLLAALIAMAIRPEWTYRPVKLRG